MMEESTPPILQQSIANSVQQAIAQTVQQLVTDSTQNVDSSTQQQQQQVPMISEDPGQAFGIGGGQPVRSGLGDETAAVPRDTDFRGVPESQESDANEAVWLEDEKIYEAQTNLLNADWKKPAVDEVMKRLLRAEITFTEAADRISIALGREVAVASVRNRARECAGLPKKSQTADEKHLGGNTRNAPESHPLATKEFGPGIYEVIRNIRGNLNSIAIKEPLSGCVRMYRRSTTRFYYCYYRCSTCDRLSSQREAFGIHPPPIIKMVRDRIVGEPFPPHLPGCKAIPLSQLRAIQIDRENRQEVIDDLQTPFEAWSRGDLRALLLEAKRISRLSKKYPHLRKVRCRSRHGSERHHHGRQHGETLASYEEKIRKKLNEQLCRPYSPASSVTSEQLMPTYDEYAPKRRRREGSTATFRDELQSLVSDLSEAPDASGLLAEERTHIEQIKMTKKDKSDEKGDDEVSSTRDGTNKQGKDCSIRDRGTSICPQTSVNESGTEVGANGGGASPAGSDTSVVSSDYELRRHPTVVTDESGRDLIRETKRKLFMVDDEHLLNLFRRCPDCGEQLKTLTLSSTRAVPIITYKCRGDCDKAVWFGYEP